MNTYKLAIDLLISHGVKIYRETDLHLWVINKHGMRDKIDKTEAEIMNYIFAD